MAKRTNTAMWVGSARRWQINVQKDGTRKTFVSSKPGRAGQREANAKADAWLEEGLQSRTTKVSTAYEAFIERTRKVTSESNSRPLESRYRTWIAPRIGRRRLEGLPPQAVQNIIDDAYAAGLSKKSLKNLRGDLTAFFKYCRKSALSTLVLDDIVIPDGARQQPKQILQPQDLLKLFNISSTISWKKRAPDPFIHYYRLAVLTGMRPGELLGLRWEDVQGREIHLCRAINQLGQVTAGKNENAVRTVVLSDLAARELEAQREQTGRLPEVFPPIREPILLRHWHRYCEVNGLTRCTLYELRHTFVSIAQQLPEGQVKAIVGHSQSMDTWGVYAHQVEGQAEQTAAALDDIFGALL